MRSVRRAKAAVDDSRTGGDSERSTVCDVTVRVPGVAAVEAALKVEQRREAEKEAAAMDVDEDESDDGECDDNDDGRRRLTRGELDALASSKGVMDASSASRRVADLIRCVFECFECLRASVLECSRAECLCA